MLADRYKVIREFKAGSFSQTFLAKDLQHPEQRRCVIKKLQPKDADAFTVRSARQLFTKEVKVLQKLGHHAQIPQLYDTFTDDQDFYLVEEFIQGHSLAQELKWGWRWQEPKVLALLQDILTTLSFVHRQRVIHRDLKPENMVRRQRDNSIVLIDFGSIQDPRVSSEIVVGTHGYMPPEQLQGQPKLSSDIYAVGMIAFQALTGVNPTKQTLATDPQTGTVQWRRYRTLSPGLANLLDSMICTSLQRRYSSAANALQAVNALIEDLETSESPRRRFLQAAGYGAMGLLGTGMVLPALAPGPQARGITDSSVANATSSDAVAVGAPSSRPQGLTSSPEADRSETTTTQPRKTSKRLKADLAPAPTPLDKAELIRRYGSYNECRKVAKARGIKFNCTPTWEKLTQAFSYSEAMQEISHRYMAAYPNTELAGIRMEVNL